MKMSNRWNRIIYRLWAPIYDASVGRLFFPGRKRAIQLLDPQPGERILLLGIGTGADLPLLPEGARAVGIDYSPDMLRKAARQLPLPGNEILLVQADAQSPSVETGSFDLVVLNLILSVIPDARACLQTAACALKRGGRAVIFDKFLQDGGHPSALRRFMNLFSTIFGTDINRSFQEMAAGTGWRVIRDEPSIAGGMYRVMVLELMG